MHLLKTHLNTFYYEPETIIPNRLRGYAKNGLKYQNAGYQIVTQVYGAGALLLNVEDMYKWYQALYVLLTHLSRKYFQTYIFKYHQNVYFYDLHHMQYLAYTETIIHF